MLNLLWCLLLAARSLLNTQRELALENLALRHQVGVLKRTAGNRRPHLSRWDRGLWRVLCRLWAGWQQALGMVQPATVIRWHREGFKRFWSKKSRAGRSGRPAVDRKVRALIRRMSKANVTLGAPRIPERTLQGRHRSVAVDRCQVHASAPQAALTDLALFSGQSRQDPGLARLLRRPDRDLSGAFRLAHPLA
jgi:hypothetical protein